MHWDGLNSALSPVVYGDIALSINTQYNTTNAKPISNKPTSMSLYLVVRYLHKTNTLMNNVLRYMCISI